MTDTETIEEKAARPTDKPSLVSRLPVPLRRLLDFFSSLKLTVAFLCLGLTLVFIGTLAQVDEGLFDAQHRYFRSFVIWWGPHGASWKLPVFPGGYLVGGVLLLNLFAAHARRFKFSKKKIGILLVHSGIVLMLLGQLGTDLLSTESAMRLEEGDARSYSENSRAAELIFIDDSNPKLDRVVSIPQNMLKDGREIRHESLPFTVRVKNFFPSSHLDSARPGDVPSANQGDGTNIVARSAPHVTDPDFRDVPTAVVELVGVKGSLGTWLVSEFLENPQTVAVGEKSYQIALRSSRYYKPYSIQLLKFTHERYKGTDTPKNFASRVRIENPDTKEAREVLIYMNNPLRYAGTTYYQAGFDPKNAKVTILQVVENPSWLTPYFSCVLVGVGLIIQFMSHLVGFAMKRRTA